MLAGMAPKPLRIQLVPSNTAPYIVPERILPDDSAVPSERYSVFTPVPLTLRVLAPVFAFVVFQFIAVIPCVSVEKLGVVVTTYAFTAPVSLPNGSEVATPLGELPPHPVQVPVKARFPVIVIVFALVF